MSTPDGSTTPTAPASGSPESPVGSPADPAPAAASRGHPWLAPLLLVLGSIGLYLPTIEYELVYDDWFLIAPVQNASMRPVVDDFGAAFALFGQEYWLGVNPENMSELRTRGQALYRPLTLFVWATILHAYGFQGIDGAVPYHVVNILGNALVALLMYLVVTRLFGNRRIAFVAGLLWAAHPLHSEAVAYIAGLSDILATAAILLGLLLWNRAVRDPARMRIRAYAGLLLTLFVGLLAKEMTILLIAVIALSDLMQALAGRAMSMARRVAVYGGLLATFAAHVLIRYMAVGYLQPDTSVINRLDNPLIQADFVTRTFNAMKLIAKYVWLTLWPEELSVDYSFHAIEVSRAWTDPEPLAGTILVAAILILGLVELKRRPPLGWGLLLFLGTALFFSNMLMPFGTIFAERLMYLPTVGAALAAAVLVDRLLVPRPGAPVHPVGLLVVVLATGALGVRTWERNKDFRNSLTLFESALEVVPDSARVHYQLGSLYANQQLFAKAAEQFEASLEDDDQFIAAAIKLGDTYLGDLNYDKAIEHYTKVYTQIRPGGDPEQTDAIRSMILTRRAEAKRGQGDLAGAREDLETALGLGVSRSPDTAWQLAKLLQNQDRYAESIPILRQVLQDVPDNTRLIMLLCRAAIAVQDKPTYEEALAQLESTEEGRGMALAMKAEVMYENAVAQQDDAMRDEAMALFEEALEADDSLATPYVYRGRYMVEKSRAFYDAIIQFDEALERNPTMPAALFQRIMACLNTNQPEEAMRSIEILETVNPNEACYALKAQAAFQMGDLDVLEEANGKLEEMGVNLPKMAVNRAVAFERQGEFEIALDIIDQALVEPENQDLPELHRSKGILLLKLGRPAEALASFQLQEVAQNQNLDAQPDLFLPINRYRSLAAQGRWAEAGAELDRAEAIAASLDDLRARNELRASLLLRRAELLLTPESARFDPEEAVVVTSEGLDVTQRRYPPMFERSIEALIATDDLEGAEARAREGIQVFAALEPVRLRLELIADALGQARGGDRNAAAAHLREAIPDQPRPEGKASLERLAKTLQTTS